MRLSRISPLLILEPSHCAIPGPWSLTPAESLRYINEEDGFRATVDAQEFYPVRLNLGDQFEAYMTDANFRTRVLAAVGQERDRVWSDVPNVELTGSQEFDMRDLAGLRNLQVLELDYCQVLNLDALAPLASLEELTLSHTGEIDVRGLGGLLNLKSLVLHRTRVLGLSELATQRSSLRFLYLGETGITDMNTLTGFSNLNRLCLVSSADLQNVHALRQLRSLRHLSVNYAAAGEDIAAFIDYLAPASVPAHTHIAAEFPEGDSQCGICLGEVENLEDCLLTCSRNQGFHRACLQLCSGRCPLCRHPLGLIP